jgi:DHA1 family tetracycline resistance protein-like MFS transporter
VKTRARSPLLFIFVTVFVDLLGYGIIVPLLPFYVQQQSPSALLVGLAGSLYAGAQFFAAPVIGGLSDRHGRKTILLCCLAGTGLAYVLLGLAGTLWLIFAAAALGGIMGGSLTTAQAYIADSTAPEQRSRGMGLIGAAAGMGLILGPASGGLLSDLGGLSLPAFIAATIAFGNVLFGLLVLSESLSPAGHRSTPIQALNPATQLLGMLTAGRVGTLLAAVFLVNLAFAGLLTNFPLYLNVRFGWDALQNGFLFAFAGVCAVLVQGVLLGRLQPRFGEARLIAAGLSLMAAGLFLVAFAPAGWTLYPLVALLALGGGLALPALTGVISRRSTAREQGRVMGGVQATLSLTLILGPILAGLVFDAIGAPAPYLLGGALVAAALAVTLASRRAEP